MTELEQWAETALAALKAAEAALEVGFDNCGQDPESEYAEPLAEVRGAINAYEAGS